jgi:hypothetical protein
MNTYCVDRSSRPAGLFSVGLLNVPLWVRLRRPSLREAPAAFGLSRLATAFIDSPGLCAVERNGSATQLESTTLISWYDNDFRTPIALTLLVRCSVGFRI